MCDTYLAFSGMITNGANVATRNDLSIVLTVWTVCLQVHGSQADREGTGQCTNNLAQLQSARLCKICRMLSNASQVEYSSLIAMV